MSEADGIARRGWATRRRPRRTLSSVPYLRGLDGMRALAVIAVMVYHANSSWLPGGFIGVEVFFVISGYLITLLLIGEHERSGRVSLRQFYARRARRLLPALFMMLALVTVYTALFKREELGRLRGDVLAALAYVSNWFQIWVGQGYTAEGQFAPLRHLWSLAVEEQFYLVWPIVMIALIRAGKGRLPSYSRWLLLAAIAVSVAVGLVFEPTRAVDPATTPDAFWNVGGHAINKTETLYLSTITRSTGLLVGGALALLWRPVAVMRGPLRDKGATLDGLALVGIGSLVVLAWRLHIVTDEGPDPLLFRGGILAVDLAAMLMIAAVSHRRSLTGRLLGMPILLWIGTRSYGLYLFHWPIFQMMRGVAGTPLDVRQFTVAMLATAF
ncbi:MAG TPA: acyltransferase, partial [Desertimonas sp.]|nr:acyltransferase [Desertimonas sp.]